ncbi:hypothetical protein D3C85_1512780 [compost metagenome]
MGTNEEVSQHILLTAARLAVAGEGLASQEQRRARKLQKLQLHLPDHFVQGLEAGKGQGQFRIDNRVDRQLMHLRLGP